MAGAPGFEPGNGGTKNRCLTTWRRPNVRRLLERGGATRNRQATASFARSARIPPQPAKSLLRRSRVLAISRPPADRSVAQPGRAPRSGRGGRRFKSCHSDQNFPRYFKQLRRRPFGAFFLSLSPSPSLTPSRTRQMACLLRRLRNGDDHAARLPDRCESHARLDRPLGDLHPGLARRPRPLNTIPGCPPLSPCPDSL